MSESTHTHKSPTLNLVISEATRQRAIESHSGSCLIADAIKEQYPQFSRVEVDMATIRVTDPKKGLRYYYLTPAAAQDVLLAFDQGWRHPTEKVRVAHAVKITGVKATGPATQRKRAEAREQRKAMIQAKIEHGEDLTPSEKATVTREAKRKAKPPTPPPDRPRSYPPVSDVIDNGSRTPSTVVGGQPLPQGASHPNLLRSRNRHFGAKQANAGKVFDEAVEKAVEERLAEAKADDSHQ